MQYSYVQHSLLLIGQISSKHEIKFFKNGNEVILEVLNLQKWEKIF
jgi:hypothetical protein